MFHQLSPIQNVLNAISDSQKWVSSNIANAHTPGYTAKSVSFSEVLSDHNNPFETSLSQKMGPSMDGFSFEDTGKPVNLQEQLIQTQKNTLFYGMATRRLTSIITSLRTASQIGR